jgi:hypothetical protein
MPCCPFVVLRPCAKRVNAGLQRSLSRPSKTPRDIPG